MAFWPGQNRLSVDFEGFLCAFTPKSDRQWTVTETNGVCGTLGTFAALAPLMGFKDGDFKSLTEP
ncbi:MAG: hypothetical protein ACI9R3_004649 [Verrucomicrobiales bacterium]|jgi:hypothetical protein